MKSRSSVEVRGLLGAVARSASFSGLSRFILSASGRRIGWQYDASHSRRKRRKKHDPVRQFDLVQTGASAFASAHFLVVNSFTMRTTTGPSTLAELSSPMPV